MSDTTSQYGHLVGAHHVEAAVVVLLAQWLDSYLTEAERVSGEVVGSTQRPRSVRVSGQVDTMPEDQTPALVVRSPGLMEIPLHDGSGTYAAQFELEVATVVSAIGVQEYGSPRALRLARIYALAIRAAIVQQSDDVYLHRRDWLDETYDVLDSIDDRTIAVSTVRFRIAVPDAVTSGNGPLVPEQTPGDVSPQWPTATDAIVDVIKVPLTEDLTQ